jgi:hypothetical protein
VEFIDNDGTQKIIEANLVEKWFIRTVIHKLTRLWACDSPKINNTISLFTVLLK